ncbi:MAG: hypothetical protein ACR2M3_11890 [Thermomicrobiales bacterium]
MSKDERREDAVKNEPGQDMASAEAASRVGRMMPIDPGVGAGGTIVSDATTGNSDVASGGDSPTEWGGGTITTGRAGVVDPTDDTPLNERRNDARDPDAIRGTDGP